VGTELDNKKHGHGTFYWANGNSHTGAWRENKMHGHGTHTWADRNSYTCAFRDNKKHGHSRHTWADGTSYEGAWHETCGSPSRSISIPRFHPFERQISRAGGAAGAFDSAGGVTAHYPSPPVAEAADAPDAAVRGL